MPPLRVNKEVNALVKKACCNYFDGVCVLLDDECPQVKCETEVICKYFRNAVLPLDKELERAVAGGNLKPCDKCGKSFVPKSNRSKYCEKCADEMKRRQTNESKRKIRQERQKIDE